MYIYTDGKGFKKIGITMHLYINKYKKYIKI